MTDLLLNVHTCTWWDEFPFSVLHLILNPTDIILPIVLQLSIWKLFLLTLEFQGISFHLLQSFCFSCCCSNTANKWKSSIVYCNIEERFFKFCFPCDFHLTQTPLEWLLPIQDPLVQLERPVCYSLASSLFIRKGSVAYAPRIEEYSSSGLVLWPVWLPQHYQELQTLVANHNRNTQIDKLWLWNKDKQHKRQKRKITCYITEETKITYKIIVLALLQKNNHCSAKGKLV